MSEDDKGASGTRHQAPDSRQQTADSRQRAAICNLQSVLPYHPCRNLEEIECPP